MIQYVNLRLPQMDTRELDKSLLGCISVRYLLWKGESHLICNDIVRDEHVFRGYCLEKIGINVRNVLNGFQQRAVQAY